MPKAFEPLDPMELVAVELPGGDSAGALDDIVQEYLFLGWKPLQILSLFRSPYYGVTHQMYRLKGEAYVKERVQRLAEEWRQGWLMKGAVCPPQGGEADA